MLTWAWSGVTDARPAAPKARHATKMVLMITLPIFRKRNANCRMRFQNILSTNDQSNTEPDN
jgi:hypothetical protein